MTSDEKFAYIEGVNSCRCGRDFTDNSFDAENLAAAWEDGYEDCLATGSMKKNLMSGKQVFVPHDTPLCCDPSSETYWSM